MKYSVVIRNRNEEKYIGHCIQSVIDFLGDDVQIILVDNESTDNSIRIVNTFDYLNIEYLTISKNLYFSPIEDVSPLVQFISELLDVLRVLHNTSSLSESS